MHRTFTNSQRPVMLRHTNSQPRRSAMLWPVLVLGAGLKGLELASTSPRVGGGSAWESGKPGEVWESEGG
jgi:hypothetical protein